MFQPEFRTKQGLLVNSFVSQTELSGAHALAKLSCLPAVGNTGNIMDIESWTSGVRLSCVHVHSLAVQPQGGYLTSPGLSFFLYQWEKHHLPWRRCKLVCPPGWSSYFPVSVARLRLASNKPSNKPSWILHVRACSEAQCSQLATSLLQHENRQGTFGVLAASLGSRQWRTCRLILPKTDICSRIVSFFSRPVLLGYNWRTALCKCKMCSIMIWFTYIMKWWAQ